MSLFPTAGRGLNGIFRSLQYRNFRLYFGGQSLSLIGSWMQRTAIYWLAYRLSNNSVFILAVVACAGQIPCLFLTPLGGVAADRYNRYKALLIAQTLAMVQASILAVLVLTGTAAVWHLAVLNILLGTINAFDMPIRQAFMVEMIDSRADLGNAIALNSSMVNAAKMLGSFLGGALIATAGEGACFTVNAISYLAVIVSLLLMRIAPAGRKRVGQGVWRQLKEGIAYTFGFAPIKYIIAFLSLASLTGMSSYMVLMPVFAKDILGGGSRAYGFLMGASGVGALAGAVYLAGRRSIPGLEKIMVLATFLFGVGLVGFSLSATMWISMIFMLLAGFGMMVQMASCNTVLQTIASDDMRGRVISIYIMSFMGVIPFGSLLAGGLAHWIGAPATLLIGGLCCVLGSVLFAGKLPYLREMIHPIYVERGVIPAVAKGIQAATDLTMPPED